ncbi:L-gulonolactone oxidase Short=LGO; AltName: Full=L-gulono-gamma-lactone oxidase; Short=GLO [Serendipita indica DSM 11827]|uniref:D-arabinono-1,4-lactone oxidase n=1 Tax=Serendipita indica (strain DSM 11827) TaxID=1109443 RepID=G4TQ04_SERID|nr:L-gulonolactone oxidase Short=LGO; AltName: Full=L-gulono-gamma-lactone oxidase; Short=GLO [Serendipita indica DSM 11827]CCA73397.1 related to l-gulonolactone oxidase [Serendipita indica DSM 11827]
MAMQDARHSLVQNASVDLKTLSVSALYDLVAPCVVPSGSPSARFANWSRTFHCTPLVVFEPCDVEQCRLIFELAQREQRTVRIVGAGLSPSDLACTSDFMLRTSKLNKLRVVDPEKHFVVCDGGIKLEDLERELATHNLALRNLGSISMQAMGGVITTATHGTGIEFKVLGDDVLSLSLLLADGTLVYCSRHENQDLFKATLCGLGSTGLVISVQIRVEPAFQLREAQVTRPFDEILANLDDIVHQAQHVRLWWYPQNKSVRVCSANRTTAIEPEHSEPSFKSFQPAFLTHHLVEFFLFLARIWPVLAYYIARYVAWMESAPKVVVGESGSILRADCRFAQHTTEWAIPYEHAQTCLIQLRDWLETEPYSENGTYPNFPIELRFSAPDDIWLSPAYGRRTCWIGIIQFKPYGLPVRYQELFRRFEAIMSSYDGRPHWAKPHHLGPHQLRRLYPHFDDFVAVLERVDPMGMFRNENVRRHIFGERGPAIDPRLFKQHKGASDSSFYA